MAKLDTHLEAANMGADQEELAQYVQNKEEWRVFVAFANASGDARAYVESSDFHPDDLIPEACAALGWDNVPSTGGLLLNFTDA